MAIFYIQNNARNNQQIAAQTRQTIRKSEKTKTRTHENGN
jgi:hypothetical protein